MEFLCFPIDVQVRRAAYRDLFDIAHKSWQNLP